MPLFREGGPFDKLYNRPIKSFAFLKASFVVVIVFVCNFVLAIQLHRVNTPALEFLQIFYLSCILFAFFSFRRLDHRYCLPAVFLAIPNFLFPITIFLYMMTAENYCYVREHFWPIEDINNTVLVETRVTCIGTFPYTKGFEDRLYVILMFGVGKLCEFLLLFHVLKSIERERISLEMLSFMAEKDKKVPPIDDTDDEMVVYKREKNVVV